MLEQAVTVLRCPHCGGALQLRSRTVRCSAGHSFDIARQGYVSLLPRDARTDTADTPAMVAARSAFLEAGHYDWLAEAIAQTAHESVPTAVPGCVTDLGAGTGYHVARVLDLQSERIGLALDVSKPALRRAARAHRRLAAVACDVWRSIPIRSRAAAVALTVCAPRNDREIHRILADDGVAVVVTPTRSHLAELTGPLGLLSVEKGKQERLDEAFSSGFELRARTAAERVLALTAADVVNLVSMGPSARHVEPAVLQAGAHALPSPVHVTASFTLSIFRRR